MQRQLGYARFSPGPEMVIVLTTDIWNKNGEEDEESVGEEQGEGEGGLRGMRWKWRGKGESSRRSETGMGCLYHS